MQENPTKEESKIATKIGYLNYLHTADAYWKDLPDGKKGTLDIHVDKYEYFGYSKTNGLKNKEKIMDDTFVLGSWTLEVFLAQM